MKFVVLLTLTIISSGVARLGLWLVNPDDPEGTNLLVTTVCALIVFAPLWLAYELLSNRHVK